MDKCDYGCKETKKYTPIKIHNTTGLSSLSYRVGTHARFKADLLANIASEKILSKLTARDDTDLSIALFDSWATVADVLTFYQERIANEGFLRTATERLSVLEIARSIGYELRTGVAASTYLAFTMDVSPSSPKKAMIDIGTKVQSIPAQNEMPQVFETVENIESRQEWNDIQPQLTEKQDIYQIIIVGRVVFDGTSTKLRVGDCLLFIINNFPTHFGKIDEVKIDAELNQTHVTFSPKNNDVRNKPSKNEQRAVMYRLESDHNIKDECDNFANKVYKIGSDTFPKLPIHPNCKCYYEDVKTGENLGQDPTKMMETVDGVYVFRVKCAVFGNNAPLWKSLPANQRYLNYNRINNNVPQKYETPVYPNDWDAQPISVFDNSLGTGSNLINLDNTYPGILPHSWIVLQNSNKVSAFQICNTREKSITGFALTSRVTSLTLNTADDIDLFPPLPLSPLVPLSPLPLIKFNFRDTTVYAMPEKLTLADISIEEYVKGKEIVLNNMIEGLVKDRPILVSGEIKDQSGIKRSEIAFLSSISETPPFTKLYLKKSLEYIYKRNTVKINANIANATHGETKNDVVGNGDPTQRFQQFALKQSPLTYVSASTPSGVESTLEIRVDGVRWNNVISFESVGKSDSTYITRTSDDGKTHIIFGNGVSGRLLPTGQENIKAKYRVGIGSSGMLNEDQITLLMTRPLGINGVTNPLKTTGGTNSENLNDARKNAPRTVLTLDRIVSLYDFKNFAQGFAGIGKAISYVVRIAGADVVAVTVASPEGENVTETSPLHEKLSNAIKLYKDPTAQFVIKQFDSKFFNVKAKILVSNDRVFEDVKIKVENALKDTFSFDNRDFGQAVTRSEVISIMQAVEGVEAIDVDFLYDTSGTSTNDDTIPNVNDVKDNMLGWLLLINKQGITLENMQ